jgi:hypothetical protein
MFDIDLWEEAQDAAAEPSPPETARQELPPEAIRRAGQQHLAPLMPGLGQPEDPGVEEFKRANRKKLQELQLRRREFWNDRADELESNVIKRPTPADNFELMERAGKWASETLENEALYRDYGYQKPGAVDRMRQAAMSTTRGIIHGAVVGNLQGGALAYSWVRDLFGAENDGPVESYQAYQLGAMIAEKAEELTDPRLRNEFLANNVAEGFGSMLSFWATARGGASVFKAAKAKELAAGTAIVAQGGALESAALYEDAISSGASERTAKMTAIWGIGLGATELVGAGQIMMKWNAATGGTFYRTLKEYWKNSAKGGFQEGLQEMFQQEGHEALAVMIYRENRRPIEESLKAGVTGGILGALMGAVASAPTVKVLRRKHKAEQWFAENGDSAVELAKIEGKVSRAQFEEITGIKEKTSEGYRDAFRNDVREAIAGELVLAVDAEIESQIKVIESQREARIREQNQRVLEETTDPIRRVGMGGVAAMETQAPPGPAADPVTPLEEIEPGVTPAPAPTVQELGIEDPTVEPTPAAPAVQPAAAPAAPAAEPAPAAQPAAAPVAQPEAVPLQQGEAIVPEVPTVQKVDEGAVVTADEGRVAELKAEGKSDEAAVKQSAAEAVAPPEVMGKGQVVTKGVSQGDAHVLGQANTIVSPEEAAAAFELLKQKGLAIGRGEKPTAGGASAIDAEMLRAIGQIGVYYGEALARAGVTLTKGVLKKFLRKLAPFNQKQNNKYLISETQLDEAIKKVMGEVKKITPENVRKRVILNTIIRWKQGDTIESTASRLLQWSLTRQAVTADEAYRASVIDENASWGEIIQYAREVLPPEMHNRIAKVLQQMAGQRMKTQKGRSRESSATTYEKGRENARAKVIQAINNLIEQYERAAAIKGLKNIIAKSKKMNLRPETQEALEGLLEDIILQDPNQATINRLRSLLEAAELDNENSTHQLPLALVEHAEKVLAKQAMREADPSQARSIQKDMTAEEIRTLTETINQLLHQMTMKNVLLARRKNLTLQQLKDEAAQGVASRFDAIRSLEPGHGDDIRTMNPFKQGLYFDQLSLDTIAYVLGGRNSAVYYVFSESLRRARDHMAEIQVAAQDHIRPVLEQLGLVGPVLTGWSEMGSRDRGPIVTMIKRIIGHDKQADRIETPLAPLRQEVVFEDGTSVIVEAENNKEARESLTKEERGRVAYTRARPTATFSKSGKRAETISLTRAERISLYLHLQDRDTRSEILSNKSDGISIAREYKEKKTGIKLTIDDVLAIEASMTKEEIAVANAMSQFFNGYLRDNINAAWVANHGYEIANLDNYFPRARDPGYYDQDPKQAMQDFLKSHLDGQGIFRARDRNIKAPIMIFDAFSVYYSHTNRSAAFIAKHGTLADAFAVLSSSEFNDAVNERFKDSKDWLNRIHSMLSEFQGISVRKESTTGWEKLTRSIIRASHVSALGLKPQIALYQTASLATASMEIAKKYLMIAQKTAGSRALRAEIRTNSATLRQRLESGGHQIMTAGYQGSALLEFYNATHRDYGGSASEMVDRGSMSLIKEGDAYVIASIWGAAKLEGADKGLTGDELIAYAKNRAVDIVDQTQPTWDVLTISQLQISARHKALLKLLVMFSSQRNKNFNMVVREVSDYSASEKTLADQRRLVGKLFMVLGVQSTMVYGFGAGMSFLIAMLWGDDDEIDRRLEEDPSSHAIEIAKKSIGNWLIAGDLVNGLIEVITSESSLPPSYRRSRGTILYGIGKDFFDAGHYLLRGASELAEDERYTGMGPRAGRKKATDTLSQALDKFIRASGMVAGLPTGAVMQWFGRGMPHRRPVKWRFEPVNQLNEIERDYNRAGSTITRIKDKLLRDPGNMDLRNELAEARQTRKSNYIAHRIWSYAERDILKGLAAAKKGRKVDELAVVMERTRLEALASAYQTYAKTGRVDQLMESSDDKFLGELVMDYTRLDPKVDPLKSTMRREEQIAKIREERLQVEPLVKAMSYAQAESALVWGYMSANQSRPRLNAYAAAEYRRQHGGGIRDALTKVREMEKDEVISIILSAVHDRGRNAGRPRYQPTADGYFIRRKKLQESFGVR